MGFFSGKREFQKVAEEAAALLQQTHVGVTLHIASRPSSNRTADRIGVETMSLEPFMLMVQGGEWLVGPAEDGAPMSKLGVAYAADPKIVAIIIATSLRFAYAVETEGKDVPLVKTMHAEMAYLSPTKDLFQLLSFDRDVFVAQMARELYEDAVTGR